MLNGCGVGPMMSIARHASARNRELLTRAPLFPRVAPDQRSPRATHYSSDDYLIVCDSYIDGYVTGVTFKSPPVRRLLGSPVSSTASYRGSGWRQRQLGQPSRELAASHDRKSPTSRTSATSQRCKHEH